MKKLILVVTMSGDLLPLKKLIYFLTLTVVIRCAFKQNGVFYPQVFLDDCFVPNIKNDFL